MGTQIVRKSFGKRLHGGSHVEFEPLLCTGNPKRGEEEGEGRKGGLRRGVQSMEHTLWLRKRKTVI